MDFAGFKKVSETEKEAVLKHPKGHEIKIAKHVISKKMRDQLKGLPLMMADGGATEEDKEPPESVREAEAASEMAAQDGQPILAANPVQPNANAPGINSQPDQNFPEVSPASSVSIPTIATRSPEDPYGFGAAGQNMMTGVQAEMGAEKNLAEATGNLGEQKATLFDAAAHAQQTYLDKLNNNMDINNPNSPAGEVRAALQDARNQRIDPGHFFHTMGVGQKIGTMVGLLLSGMGSGLAHQDNLAMRAINDAVNNDINAQIKNMDNKNNLVGAYMRQFGDLNMATQMATAVQKGIVADQIEAAAARSSSPIAKAQAQAAIGKLLQDKASALQTVAMKQTALQMGSPTPQRLTQGQTVPAGMTTGVTPQPMELNPAVKIRNLAMAGIMSPQEQEESLKELKTAEAMSKQKDNLKAAFNTVDENNTVLNRAGHLGFTPPKTAAARDPLLAQLVKDSEGRITPTDIDLMKPLFPSPGDNQSTVSDKWKNLNKFIDERMNFPHLDQYNINPYHSRFQEGSSQKKFQLGAPVK